MKAKSLWAWPLSLALAALSCIAAEPANVEKLQQQLQQMQDNFNRIVREQQSQIEALKQQLEEVRRSQTSAATVPVPAASAAVEPRPETASVAKPWSPTDPIRVGKGSAYADIGLVATFAVGASTADDIEGGTQLGGHDPNQRGFTVQGVELNLQGAIDPYLRGNANILFSLDSGGESFVELEEAWMETTALPWNLQLRAGQMLTDFGRINTQHPHSWAFVDSPLVNGRFLGGDGLRNPGARLAWLVPTPFYSELFFAVQNSQGETAHSFRSDHEGDPFLGRLHDQDRVRTFTDMLLTTRYAASFDLTDNQTLLAGASVVFGPNGSGGSEGTQIYGVDAYWKWKSPTAHGGFPFVSLQTEAMLRRMQVGAFSEDLDGSGTLDPGEPDLNGDGMLQSVARETLTDWGFYSQLLYGFRKGWVAGLRGEYMGRASQADYEQIYSDDPERLGRWRISPNLTWYPSEFSKLRLQYNLDERQQLGMDHSVWLQFEFLLGAHAAHKF